MIKNWEIYWIVDGCTGMTTYYGAKHQAKAYWDFSFAPYGYILRGIS